MSSTSSNGSQNDSSDFVFGRLRQVYAGGRVQGRITQLHGPSSDSFNSVSVWKGLSRGNRKARVAKRHIDHLTAVRRGHPPGKCHVERRRCRCGRRGRWWGRRSCNCRRRGLYRSGDDKRLWEGQAKWVIVCGLQRRTVNASQRLSQRRTWDWLRSTVRQGDASVGKANDLDADGCTKVEPCQQRRDRDQHHHAFARGHISL